MSEIPYKKDPKEGVVRTPVLKKETEAPVEPVPLPSLGVTEEKHSVKSLEESLMELLNNRITMALSYEKKMLGPIENDEPDGDAEETDIEKEIRMDIVSEFLKESENLLHIDFRKKIADEHRVSIYRQAGDLYPDQRKWIKENERIAKNLSKYPFFYPLLNFIFNMTRYPKKGIKEIEDLAGGKRYTYIKDGKDHSRIYSAFKVDEDFYKKVRENVYVEKAGKRQYLSRPTAKKYLKAMIDAGIIIQLANEGKYGRILADGYYVIFKDGKNRKFAFLKNTPSFRKALADLTISFNSLKS